MIILKSRLAAERVNTHSRRFRAIRGKPSPARMSSRRQLAFGQAFRYTVRLFLGNS
jgi:hypothetical protein